MKRTRYFQWIDGEYAGNVTKLVNITEEDGEYFYNFDDGETCNLRFVAKMTSNAGDLKNKFVVEIASPNDKWGFHEITTGSFKNADDTFVEVPPLEDITGAKGQGQSIDIESSKVGTKKLIPPKYRGMMSELPSLDDYFYDEEAERRKNAEKIAKNTTKAVSAIGKALHKEINHQPEVISTEPILSQDVYAAEEPISATVTPVSYTPPSAKSVPSYNDYNGNASTYDPIRILAKTCKKHPTEVDLTLTINLPKKAIFDLATSEFDDKTGEKFVNYLIENIDINEIISSLKDSLIDAYTNGSDEI